MRVDHLFIIGVVADKPAGPNEKNNVDITLKQMKILADKHRSKCKYITSYAIKYANDFRSFIDPINMTTSDDESAFMTKYNPGKLQTALQDMIVPKEALVAYTFEPEEIEATSKERVGVYLIGNLDREDFVLEALWIDPIVGLLKDKLEFSKIDKLCLIACGAARRGVSSKDNKLPNDVNTRTDTKTQNANEKCYLYQLCKALAAGPKPLTPMIAGWDGFVEIAGADKDIDAGVEGGVGEADAGKKIIELPKSDKRDRPARVFARPSGKPHAELGGSTGTNKRVISFRNGKPTWHLQQEGWSDKA